MKPTTDELINKINSCGDMNCNTCIEIGWQLQGRLDILEEFEDRIDLDGRANLASNEIAKIKEVLGR